LLENLPSSFTNPLIPLTQSQRTNLFIFNLSQEKLTNFSNLYSSLVLIQIKEVLDFISNSKLAQINNKLTVQSKNFADDSCAIRSLDWDRSRFDIEFGLRNGTTYNSFIIKGEKLAIIDTSHAKFEELWFEELLKEINPQEVDYLITSHTEPDHSGFIGNLLELNKNIKKKLLQLLH